MCAQGRAREGPHARARAWPNARTTSRPRASVREVASEWPTQSDRERGELASKSARARCMYAQRRVRITLVCMTGKGHWKMAKTRGKCSVQVACMYHKIPLHSNVAFKCGVQMQHSNTCTDIHATECSKLSNKRWQHHMWISSSKGSDSTDKLKVQ